MIIDQCDELCLQYGDRNHLLGSFIFVLLFSLSKIMGGGGAYSLSTDSQQRVAPLMLSIIDSLGSLQFNTVSGRWF